MVLIFLQAGAVVNVAVAWGFAAWVNVVADMRNKSAVITIGVSFGQLAIISGTSSCVTGTAPSSFTIARSSGSRTSSNRGGVELFNAAAKSCGWI